jgi:hypothetical protein
LDHDWRITGIRVRTGIYVNYLAAGKLNVIRKCGSCLTVVSGGSRRNLLLPASRCKKDGGDQTEDLIIHLFLHWYVVGQLQLDTVNP